MDVHAIASLENITLILKSCFSKQLYCLQDGALTTTIFCLSFLCGLALGCNLTTHSCVRSVSGNLLNTWNYGCDVMAELGPYVKNKFVDLNALLATRLLGFNYSSWALWCR